MDERVRERFTGKSRVRLWLLTASVALVVSGCVNPAFRESVGQFGAVSKAAATAQNERLAVVTANEQERIRAALVTENPDLRIHPDCAVRLDQEPTADEPPAPSCTIVRRGGGTIDEPQRFAQIIALNSALANYADSLIALAADATEDEAAFTSAVAGLATSLGGLENAFLSAIGQETPVTGGRLGLIADLVAEAGNLYFAHQRNRVLKRIIRRANPLVQDAVRLLAEADNRLRFNERVRLGRELDEAEEAVADARNGSAEELRSAHDRLFDRLDAYNRHGEGLRNYTEIGVAHERLRAAAEAGASPAELKAAIEAIIHLAGTAHQAVTAPTTQSNGSSTNGN